MTTTVQLVTKKTGRVLAAIAAALILLASASAQAHDTVISVEPSDGATVAEVFTIRLTFSQVPEPGTAVIAVLDDQGVDWVRGAPGLGGTTVVQALDPQLPEGPYNLSWRVVSSDGHPISGSSTLRSS